MVVVVDVVVSDVVEVVVVVGVVVVVVELESQVLIVSVRSSMTFRFFLEMIVVISPQSLVVEVLVVVSDVVEVLVVVGGVVTPVVELWVVSEVVSYDVARVA